LRYRLELRDDVTFSGGAYEDDAAHLVRSRLHLQTAFDDWLSVFAQAQDAESFASSSLNRTAAFVNRLDLRQMYADIASPWEGLPGSLRLGRQELSYGDQRFVGAFGWSNVARVFDAAKVSLSPIERLQLDAWFSQVVVNDRVRPDTADHAQNFYGLYVQSKPVPDHELDAFVFIRHDRDNELAGERPGELGQLKEYTVGNRLKGQRKNIDYSLEWAWQFGSRAHDDIRAWAWHSGLGYTFRDAPWTPRMFAEFNHGSGDDDPRDGTVKNFSNLFPTNHLHYGYMDLASLRNLNHVELGLIAKPRETLTLRASHHWLWLDTNKSAWFNAGQGVIRPTAVSASRTLGQEIDLTANWKFSRHADALVGYSHFHAGAFIQDTGAADDANFAYVQVTVGF